MQSPTVPLHKAYGYVPVLGFGIIHLKKTVPLIRYAAL